MFERQMNSYTPPGSLRKSMAQGFPRSEAVSPLLIGEMMLSQIVDHLLMFLKTQLCLKKKEEKKREHKQTGIPRG